ncbi:hypothetical protein GLAREA_10403 [Glarea lozoyensis ATCC 20868]|uniref:Uncharacterized protein n=1 Tax=Glarea lozoyensis (strain ATCC 20868 / MF5171) TaxID=1116229 RepID=S3DC91_GLAL2|nr:uncharacterized protein GLAREA_10403 [Glarea lozoyensis ATCC 20868]EPE34709.1 hypothetical protein GLAREA_10403 [Glarea lozoyensis ATCC 20868]
MPRSAFNIFRSLTLTKSFLRHPRKTIRVWRYGNECDACGAVLEIAPDGREYCIILNCVNCTDSPIGMKGKSHLRRLEPDDRLEFPHDIGRHKQCRCGLYYWEVCVRCALWDKQKTENAACAECELREQEETAKGKTFTHEMRQASHRSGHTSPPSLIYTVPHSWNSGQTIIGPPQPLSPPSRITTPEIRELYPARPFEGAFMTGALPADTSPVERSPSIPVAFPEDSQSTIESLPAPVRVPADIQSTIGSTPRRKPFPGNIQATIASSRIRGPFPDDAESSAGSVPGRTTISDLESSVGSVPARTTVSDLQSTVGSLPNFARDIRPPPGSVPRRRPLVTDANVPRRRLNRPAKIARPRYINNTG